MAPANEHAWLYFHSPCFDGIASCVLAADFLENHGWRFDRFCPVDYSARATWVSQSLQTPCAVVDFLYHPQATFWADHHSTTFVSPYSRENFIARQHGRWMFFDDKAGSCARLLWVGLADRFGFQNPKYEELVSWAEKIDAARYASVEEAILGDTPALRIHASLGACKDSPSFFEYLVTELRTKTLAEVAQFPEIALAAAETRSKVRAGLELLRPAAHLEEGEIVVFDVTPGNVIVNRYAPYYFFSQARYSIGLVRSPENMRITAMRNPWREFPSAPLGQIFAKYGGGGHQRVGALLLSSADGQQANSVLQNLIRDIRAADPVEEPQASPA